MAYTHPIADRKGGWWGALFVGAAFGAASGAAVVYWIGQRNQKVLLQARSSNVPGCADSVLGPEVPKRALRFPLDLRGRVDRIFELGGPRPFEFNEEVVRVFDDMVSRSVPLYCEVTDLLVYWVHRYAQAGTAIVDLGCSTGTTLDVIARSFDASAAPPLGCSLVGIDNSPAMVSECRAKLEWVAKLGHKVKVIQGDILTFPMKNSSFVVMNYTLQFIPVNSRQEMLGAIFAGLVEGGVLFLSEKVRSESSEFQETCTWIYEDFKERRGYSKREIARKKDALMNVLVPFTEAEMRAALNAAGFEHVEIVAKWNNFTTFVARKTGRIQRLLKGHGEGDVQRAPNMEALFDFSPEYLSAELQLPPLLLQRLCAERLGAFSDLSKQSASNLAKFDAIAQSIARLPKGSSGHTHLVCNKGVLEIGRASDLSPSDMKEWRQCAEDLRPWKKGPLSLFGVEIDTEWRSDWKWDRIKPACPGLKGKTVCDLGCGNGYFMFRMLEHNPRVVVGIDPNLHAWLEFQAFKRSSGIKNIHLELLRGDSMQHFVDTFDIVFCLGVLYHTPDPIGMLRSIHKSMTKGGHLIVDCSGIPGEDPVALFPKKKYAGMGSVYFFPTLPTLKVWLQRAQFIQHEVIFAEKLSTEEQRITEWAPVNASLAENLDAHDPTKTKEGYPAPHRFYIRAKRG